MCVGTVELIGIVSRVVAVDGSADAEYTTFVVYVPDVLE